MLYADRDKVDYINVTLYDLLKKTIFIKHDDMTKGGDLNACGLVFKNVYLDHHNLIKKSAPVVVIDGSFNVIYDDIHHDFRSMLKVVPSIIGDYNNPTKFKAIYPYYLDIFFNGNSLSKYKKSDFKCDNGGRCSAYLDDELGTKIISNVIGGVTDTLEGEVKLSLFKNGIDTSFLFSSLIPKRKYELEALGFIGCLEQLIKQKASAIVDEQ